MGANMHKFFIAAALVALAILLNPYITFASGFDYSKLKGRRIMLDPGHGGDDCGAVRHGVKESHLNLSAALYLRKFLELSGADVIMTRDTDEAVSLNARFDAIDKVKPDLFISMHHNDAADSFYAKPDFKNYTEVYFSALYDGNAANIISGLSFYGAFQKLYKVGTVKIKPGYFRVIRNKNIPSILMEPFFMGDESLVKTAVSPSYSRHEALVYLRAAANYFAKLEQAIKSEDLQYAIPPIQDLTQETFDVFLSSSTNEYFLKTAAELLNLNNFKTVANSEPFLGDKNISSYYASKLLALKDYLEPDLLPAYIEAIRSNSVSAKIHVSLSFDSAKKTAVYAYYKSVNGKKLSETIICALKAAGIVTEFKPDSFYILSSTSSVTVVLNLNPQEINLSDKHKMWEINMAVYSAVKNYLSSK